MTTLAETAPPSPPAGQAGLLGAPAPDLATHQAVHGRLPIVDPARFRAEVERSGLTGRGGAGFPAAIKLGAVAAVSHGRAVVVGNAAEGEPGSAKDRQLLISSPHLVLDGLQLAAAAVGAARVILYVRPDAVAAAERAVAERRAIDRLPVTITRRAAGGFVAGQETAVVSALNGGPALPQYAPVRVTDRGVGGHPTLVQNAETLAHLALIARHGGAWFASTGVPGSTGSFLATVHTLDGEPAVWEVPHGTTVRTLLATAAGTPVDELQAVLLGGYHGSWLRLPQALDAPLSRDGLQPYGAGVGAGVVIPIGWRTCGLETTAAIVRYLAAESARQCGPCMFGLPHLAGLLSRLAAGSAAPADLAAIRAGAGLVAGRGACHHPDGTVRLVRSALAAFEGDITLHGHGRCLARTGNEGGWL